MLDLLCQALDERNHDDNRQAAIDDLGTHSQLYEPMRRIRETVRTATNAITDGVAPQKDEDGGVPIFEDRANTFGEDNDPEPVDRCIGCGCSLLNCDKADIRCAKCEDVAKESE